MLFLGTAFFSGLHTLDPPAVSVSPITEIKLTNGTFDHLYASKIPKKPSKARIMNGMKIPFSARPLMTAWMPGIPASA